VAEDPTWGGGENHLVADDKRSRGCEPSNRNRSPTEGVPMKLTVLRAIPLVLVTAVAALVVSGVPRFKNAKHGFDYVVGEIAWLGFLVAALSLLILVAVAVGRLISRRRSVPARA
jgi:hypothetical protein